MRRTGTMKLKPCNCITPWVNMPMYTPLSFRYMPPPDEPGKETVVT